MKKLSKQINNGFQRAYNPHLKKKGNKGQAYEEEKASNDQFAEEREKMSSILISKEYFAKELIKNGYIDSYIDFFYLGWGKTPNLKQSYSDRNKEEKIENENEEDQKEEEEEIDEVEIDQNIPRHEYNIQTLQVFYEKLTTGENALRDAEKEKDNELYKSAIEQYNSIRNDTIHDQGEPLEAIYFNQKCIDISKKYNLIEFQITSLIMMGGCFDKMSNPNDMNISKSLKEEARDIFTQNLSGQNYTLEASIYKALIELYNEIANQQEQMKNYTKAIDLLYKLLEVLDCLNAISDNLKEGGMGQKENEDKKTETYLKISNLYYRINDYEHTIETLAKIANIKSDSGDSTLTVRNYYIIYIYFSLIKFKDYIVMLKHMKCKVIMKMQLLI
jgi:hypothetical protein